MANGLHVACHSIKGPFSGDDNATKCFEPLGCLEINEKWYSINRPVNMMPQPRQVINTQFILRTRKAYETVSAIPKYIVLP